MAINVNRVRFHGNGTMIFRHEREDGTVWYTTSLSACKNDENGNPVWENGSIQIQFKQGVDIPDKTLISFEYEDAWLSFYKKEKTPVFYIFCKDYKVVEAKEEGRNLTTKVDITNGMIFRNDYNGRAFYNVGVSKRNKDKEWENTSMPIRFKKDIDLPNQAKITSKPDAAWVSFYKKDGKSVFYVFCNDFEVVG